MGTHGASGIIKHLRICDSADIHGYGTPDDPLGTEVVVVLEGSDRYFGLSLTPGPELPSRLAMLSAIREAFFHRRTIGFLYEAEDGRLASTILHIDLDPPPLAPLAPTGFQTTP